MWSRRALAVTLLVLLTTPLAAARSDAVAAPAALPPLSCLQESSLQSLAADAMTVVIFDNETARDVSIFWLDYAGQRVLYTTLAARMVYRQETFVTHPWVVTDSTGTCLAIFEPAATPDAAVIVSR